MTRPSPAGLYFSGVVSLFATALVAVDVLGLVWLLLGPVLGATLEIAVSHWRRRGPDAAFVSEPGPVPAPSGAEPAGAWRRV